MAGLAAALDLAAMWILAAMAVDTVLAELLLGGRRAVAGVTGDLGVRADEPELVAPEMIVVDRLPSIVIVAVLAFAAKAPGVRVVGPMAAVAVLWNLFLVVAAAMTGQAVE